MACIYISVGSNIDPEKNIRSGVADLEQLYPKLLKSSVYASEAEGFVGNDFYNLVVRIQTAVDVWSVIDTLKAIEKSHDRARQNQAMCSRTLDMDLLLYDKLVLNENGLQLPRQEITQYAFVLGPLAEIAGDLHHPINGKQYKILWQEFDQTQQVIDKIDFCW